MSNKTNQTIVDYIYNDQVPLHGKEYQHLVTQNKELLITPLKIMALLIAVSGLFAMVFEVRYFSQFSVNVYLTRLLSTFISFVVLTLMYTKKGRENPLWFVHILLLVIIISSGYMIFLIPQTLVVNSQIVGLMIFTSALILSWDVKNQIIVAIYYNLVFAAAIILNEKAIYFLPHMYESVIFVLFLSVISVIGSAVNFSLKMKLAEKSYRVELSENKYRSIFDNSAEGVFQSSLMGRFLTVNGALVKILGYDKKDELMNVNIEFDVYKYAGERQKIIKELEEKDEIKGKTVMLKRKDGSDVVVRLNVRVYTDEDGRKKYFEGTIQDITEQAYAENKRKKIEEELRKEKIRSDQLAKDAMQSSLAKSQFLANMSHEIRTPMNGIIGFLSLIERGAYDDNNELMQFTNNAKSSAESLLDLVNDILDLSKIESGKMILESIDFNLDDILEESISILSTKIKEKRLKINKVIDDNALLYLKGDPKRIRQIIINLLSNAVKFTDKGSITLSVSTKEKDTNKFEILVTVKDTGIGIPANRMNALFEPFSQADSSHTRKYGGTGLGLAICKEFVNAMGGQIGVDSNTRYGSKFYFTMLLEKGNKDKILQPDPQQATKAPSEQLPGRSSVTKKEREQFKLLLAEDNFINQKVALRILREAGYSAEPVMNGKDAVEAVAEKKFDLVLMDVQMPEMDGFTATKKIREADHSRKSIPIIAITAHALLGDKEKCMEAGMNDYLSKPINAETLILKLDKWLNVKASDEKITPKSEKKKDVIFDFDHLDKMASGDEEFRKELLVTYFEDIIARLVNLEKFIEVGDFQNIIGEAHTIKGASYSVGAKKIGDEAYGIELSGKVKDIKNALERIRPLKAAVEETRKILKIS